MEHLSFDRPPYDLSVSGRRKLSPSVFRAIQSSLDLCHFDRPLLQNLTGFTFKPDYGGISLRDACVFLGLRLKTLDFTIGLLLDSGPLRKLSKPDVPLLSIYTSQTANPQIG